MFFEKSEIFLRRVRFNNSAVLRYIVIFVFIFIPVVVSIFFKSDFLGFLNNNIGYISLYFVGLFLVYYTIKILPDKILHLFFRYLFKYRVCEIENWDIFTNKIDYLKDEKVDNRNKKETIFFITSLTCTDDIDNDKYLEKERLEDIKREYVKLAFFWYAHNFDRVKLRATLPFLSFVLSILFFVFYFFILDNLDFGEYNNFIKMSAITLFLFILYYVMLDHVNKFLNLNYYIHSIDTLFKKSNINFKDIKYTQKILLFLDKTFLISIYDKKLDSFTTLNEDRNFENFILNADLDKEGRDYIINIFVSIFIVIYITIYVEVFVESDADRFVKDSKSRLMIDKIEHNISIKAYK